MKILERYFPVAIIPANGWYARYEIDGIGISRNRVIAWALCDAIQDYGREGYAFAGLCLESVEQPDPRMRRIIGLVSCDGTVELVDLDDNCFVGYDYYDAADGKVFTNDGEINTPAPSTGTTGILVDGHHRTIDGVNGNCKHGIDWHQSCDACDPEE